jgi:hypothetical protein
MKLLSENSVVCRHPRSADPVALSEIPQDITSLSVEELGQLEASLRSAEEYERQLYKAHWQRYRALEARRETLEARRLELEKTLVEVEYCQSKRSSQLSEEKLGLVGRLVQLAGFPEETAKGMSLDALRKTLELVEAKG